MADILSGESEACSRAPLSTAQTIAICQHLDKQIKDVEKAMTDLQREVMHQNEHIQNLKSKSGDAHDKIHTLNVGLASTNASFDKLVGESSRIGSGLIELQASQLGMREKIVQLDEAKKIADTMQEMLSRELKAEKEKVSGLTSSLDKVYNTDIKKLRNDFANSNLTLNQVAAEQAQTAELGQQNRDFLREAKKEIESVVNEVKKANTVTGILENRLVRTDEIVQQYAGKFGDLNDQLVRITECYEQTKARVGESELRIKEVHDMWKKTDHDLEDRTRDIEAIADKLKSTISQADQNSQNGNEIRQQLNSCFGNLDNLRRQVQSMQVEINDSRDSVNAVKQNLREQSAILLPNINRPVSPAGGGSSAPSSTQKGRSGGGWAF